MFRLLQVGYLVTLLITALWMVREIDVIGREEARLRDQFIPALDSYSIIENIQIPVGELREKIHQYREGSTEDELEIHNATEVVNSRFYILTNPHGPLSKTFNKAETKIAVQQAFVRFEKITARVSNMLAGKIKKDLVIRDLTDFRQELATLNSQFYTEQINNYNNTITMITNVRETLQRVVVGWIVFSLIFVLFILVNQAFSRRLIRQREEALDRKHVFIAMFNHEIRNPLQGISAAAENLFFVIEDMDSTMTEKRFEDVRPISEKISNQVDLIESRLIMFGQYSRLESGQVTVTRENVDVEDFVAGIVHDYLKIAEQKKISLTFGIAKNIGVLNLDRDKTDQILRNLIENAIKYTAAGKVHVFVSTTVKYRRSIRIEVRDTGIGVAEEDIKAIFRPFVRRSETKERYYGGSLGLGLTIVELLAKTLGGHAEVQSRDRQGATFAVEFPV
jgi:signal transduction histidine kinase